MKRWKVMVILAGVVISEGLLFAAIVTSGADTSELLGILAIIVGIDTCFGAIALGVDE